MHFSSDDSDIGTRLMSADTDSITLEAARLGRQHSHSNLSPSSALGRTQLQRDRSAPDSLHRQTSDSIARPISRSGSRTGPTALNIPLSTQHPSILLSAAGERVRAYSDSATAQDMTDALDRPYADSAHLVRQSRPPLEAQKEVDEYTPVSSQEQRRQQSTIIHPLPRPEDICLIAFVNFNSGGKTGARIAAAMQRELGAERVFNLGDKNPAKESPHSYPTPSTEHPLHLLPLSFFPPPLYSLRV